jgi:peroxiredoxin
MKTLVHCRNWQVLTLMLAILASTTIAWAELPRVAELDFVNLQGAQHSLADATQAKAVVLIFMGTECPVSNGYVPEYNRLQAEFGARGVLFFGFYPDPDVSQAEAEQHVAEYKIGFPVALDPQQALATKVGVRVTPEAVVLRTDGQVVYRGRIDDRYLASGKRRNEASQRELADAIRAVLEGKSPQVSETKAFGCPLPKTKS